MWNTHQASSCDGWLFGQVSYNGKDRRSLAGHSFDVVYVVVPRDLVKHFPIQLFPSFKQLHQVLLKVSVVSLLLTEGHEYNSESQKHVTTKMVRYDKDIHAF